MIDRVGPTRMPRTPIRGYQRWRTLCFMHWEVPETELAKVVPRGLTVDTFDGSAYVGLVTFGMEGVRPRWSPDALAFDFLETNVRTYVRGPDGLIVSRSPSQDAKEPLLAVIKSSSEIGDDQLPRIPGQAARQRFQGEPGRDGRDFIDRDRDSGHNGGHGGGGGGGIGGG